MKTKYVIIKGQVRIVMDAVKVWQSDRHKYECVEDIQYLIKMCLDWPDIIGQIFKYLWDVAFIDESLSVEFLG